MAGLLAPGPTRAAAEELRARRGSRGLLEAVGTPLSYAPFAPVAALGQGLLGAQYLTGEKDFASQGMPALADLALMGVATQLPPGLRNGVLMASRGMKDDVTAKEVAGIQDIPTPQKIRQAIDAVGEDEFRRIATAKIAKYRPSDVHQEAMLVEAAANEIVAKASRTSLPDMYTRRMQERLSEVPNWTPGEILPAGRQVLERTGIKLTLDRSPKVGDQVMLRDGRIGSIQRIDPPVGGGEPMIELKTLTGNSPTGPSNIVGVIDTQTYRWRRK